MELFGLIAAFSAIFFLRLKDFDHALTILTAAVIIGLTSAKSFHIFPPVILKTASDMRTWEITAAVAMITLLGYVLKETRLILSLIESLRGILTSRALVAIIPAIFGVLSMPGGAIISAPFNEPEAERLGLKPEEKSFINLWFRHVWYWASPISPTTYLAVSIAGLAIRDFIMVNVFLFLTSWAIGYLLLRRIIPKNIKEEPPGPSRNYRDVVFGLSPIATALFLTFLEVPVWLAVMVGIFLALLIRPLKASALLTLPLKGISWPIAAAVPATLFFRDLLTATDYIPSLLQSVIDTGVPLLILIIVIPLIIGSISGMPTMGIGIVFPLLLPILPSINIAYITIIFAGITTGYMASPLHLCLVLTNHYYQSDLKLVFRLLMPPTFVLYAIAVIYHSIRLHTGLAP